MTTFNLTIYVYKLQQHIFVCRALSFHVISGPQKNIVDQYIDLIKKINKFFTSKTNKKYIYYI